MRLIARSETVCVHSRYTKPVAEVEVGEVFAVETELCSGGWLQSLDDQYAPERSEGPNPTVVVGVAGALPGQCLKVHIHDIEPEGLGYTGFGPGMTPFPDWLRHREWGVVAKTVAIRDGFVEWGPGQRLSVDPMIGTLGTAPAAEVFSNAWPGRHGGNMDAQELRRGATVWLPVEVPGALLHVGDVHALQGDGEINCGGGIECRSTVTLSVDLAERPRRMGWPRVVDEEHITCVGCARPAEDAFRIAVEQLIYWMADGYGFDEREAHLLLGQVLEARGTQYVDPLYTYVAKIKRRYLDWGSK